MSKKGKVEGYTGPLKNAPEGFVPLKDRIYGTSSDDHDILAGVHIQDFDPKSVEEVYQETGRSKSPGNYSVGSGSEEFFRNLQKAKPNVSPTDSGVVYELEKDHSPHYQQGLYSSQESKQHHYEEIDKYRGPTYLTQVSAKKDNEFYAIPTAGEENVYNHIGSTPDSRSGTPYTDIDTGKTFRLNTTPPKVPAPRVPSRNLSAASVSESSLGKLPTPGGHGELSQKKKDVSL